MTTYSTSLKLTLPGDGELSGVWGQTTNNNLGTLLEEAIVGSVNITMLDANYTLSNLNGTTDEARQAILVVGGTNSAIRKIIAPLAKKIYTITNNTTGGFAIQIGATTGAYIVIPNGMTTTVYCNGTDFVNGLNGVSDTFKVTTNLNVGGTSAFTGATTVGSTLGVSGLLTASTGIAATTGTFSGNLASLGSVSGASGIFGAVSGTTGTFTGAVSGTTGTFSGAVSGTAISGTTGTFSGIISGQNGLSIGGTVTTAGLYGDSTNIAIRGYSSGAIYFQSNGGGLTYAVLGTSGLSLSTGSYSGAGTGLTGTASNLTVGTATNATNVFNTTNPVGGTYKLLLGLGTNSQSAVYNFSTLYIDTSNSTIYGANINGNAATVTNGVYNDGGSYNINIGGNAGSATFSGYANALNTGNSYTVSGLAISGNGGLNSGGWVSANTGGQGGDCQIVLRSSSAIGSVIALNLAGNAYRWMKVGEGSPILMGASSVNSGASLTLGSENGNGNIWCNNGNAANGFAGGYGWAMVNNDGRMGAWSVGSGFVAVYLDGVQYGINIVPSDESIKKNIVPSTYNALSTVNKIAFKSFDYDEEKTFSKGHIACGVTSQQLETIDPNLVMEVGDLKQPCTDKLLYIALKAIQELEAKVTALEAKLAK